LVCHVAILQPRYLKLILQGKKTLESRLTLKRLPPWNVAHAGQTIYFKQTSGPFRCKAVIQRVHSFDNLTPQLIQQIKARFNDGILGDDTYWSQKQRCRYATIIELSDVTLVTEGPAFPRSHGLAWFVVEE
jgi:ASC-1-like (ASCH) protein